MKKIYFASPLFSHSELFFNSHVVNLIRDHLGASIDIYLPQENDSINDKSQYADSIMIADGDNKYLEESDILIALIDGQVMDVGVAAEIGYFYSMNKPIIALYTDSRQGTFDNQKKIDALDEIAESQFSYANLYVIGLIKRRGKVVNSVTGLIEMLDQLM